MERPADREIRFPRYIERGGGTAFVSVSGMRDVPFEIRRIFYIYGTGEDGVVRGKHANRRSEFVLFNISGSSKVRVIDADGKARVYELNEPGTGLYLPRMVWKEMYDFSADSVLMVLSSEVYDPEEYIRDFDAFVLECGRQ